jgi:hypothetical protein
MVFYSFLYGGLRVSDTGSRDCCGSTEEIAAFFKGGFNTLLSERAKEVFETIELMVDSV